MAVVNLTYKYRGIIDYARFYKEGRAFFLNIVDPDDFSESKYKDKGNEFEGKWEIGHNYDEYHKITYKVEFKAWDLSPATIDVDGEKKSVYDGKIRIYISGDLKEHYPQGDVGGSRELFKKDSLAEKIYKRIMRRTKEEDVEGTIMVTVHKFIDLVKEICEADARY